MPQQVEGPCEPTLSRVQDGRVLLVFRLQSGYELWRAWSSDGGRSWTEPSVMSGVWAVWPQLQLMSNGVLLLSSGRPGLGLWVSRDGVGNHWDFFNIAAEHNRHFPPPSPWAFATVVANVSRVSSPDANPAQTTSYTSLIELRPNVAYLSYDRLRVGCPSTKTERWCQQHGLGYDGGRDYVFTMVISV